MFLLFASTLDVEQTGWCSHHHGTTKSLHSSANYTRWQQGSKLISSSLSLSTRVNMKQHRPNLANKLSQPADFEARCHLRCASSLSLIVCHTRLSTILTARVWNSLPQHVTSASSLSVFCSRLKTHLFRRCYTLDCTHHTVVPEKWHCHCRTHWSFLLLTYTVYIDWLI